MIGSQPALAVTLPEPLFNIPLKTGRGGIAKASPPDWGTSADFVNPK